LTAKVAKEVAKFAKRIIPRVQVETPAPPALRKERIGKETAAGMIPPVCVLSKSALGFWLLALGLTGAKTPTPQGVAKS
jgi:hypothetical protein